MDDLSLILGKDLKIGNITIKHPKVLEILEVGEEFYFSATNIFTLNPYDMMVELYENGIDYRTLKPYDIFIMLCGETLINKDGKIYINKESEVSKKIGWITGIYDFHLFSDEEHIYMYSDSTGYKIDLSIYNEIRKFFIALNHIDDKPKYNPGNDSTIKFLVSEEKKKRKKNSRRKKKSVFASSISCLMWYSNKNIDELKNLYIYQFFDGIERINKIKEYDNICFGYYSGNIKHSDFKNIISKVNWMN